MSSACRYVGFSHGVNLMAWNNTFDAGNRFLPAERSLQNIVGCLKRPVA